MGYINCKETLDVTCIIFSAALSLDRKTHVALEDLHTSKNSIKMTFNT